MVEPLYKDEQPDATMKMCSIIVYWFFHVHTKFGLSPKSVYLTWQVAESLNGRAIALGVMLRLGPEVLEPGHPSLLKQVIDRVVPIAQKSPPILFVGYDCLATIGQKSVSKDFLKLARPYLSCHRDAWACRAVHGQSAKGESVGDIMGS